MRAYLMLARQLQKNRLSYGWILSQIRDVNTLRRHYKEIEEGDTKEILYNYKEVA